MASTSRSSQRLPCAPAACHFCARLPSLFSPLLARGSLGKEEGENLAAHSPTGSGESRKQAAPHASTTGKGKQRPRADSSEVGTLTKVVGIDGRSDFPCTVKAWLAAAALLRAAASTRLLLAT